MFVTYYFLNTKMVMENFMDEKDLDKLIFEFHEKVIEIAPERRNQLKEIMLEELHKA